MRVAAAARGYIAGRAGRRRRRRSQPASIWSQPRSAISRDITLRALETLAAADVIACEDTRVTRKLLDHYGIATPLTPYHEHNAAAARPKLLARLADGRGGRARVRRRNAADLRSRLQAGARGARRRPRRDGASRARRRCWRRSPSRACRPTGSSSRASCRRSTGSGAQPHRRARAHPGDARAVRDRPAARRRARRSRRPGSGRARPRSAAS